MNIKLVICFYVSKMATFIFCKAYIAIFKEHLLSESESFREGMGKDEQILNSQLVIFELVYSCSLLSLHFEKRR